MPRPSPYAPDSSRSPWFRTSSHAEPRQTTCPHRRVTAVLWAGDLDSRVFAVALAKLGLVRAGISHAYHAVRSGYIAVECQWPNAESSPLRDAASRGIG
jgi:hypothetical protein